MIFIAFLLCAGVRPRALLQAPSGPALILRRGDYVAKEQLKVTTVAPDGIRLEHAVPGQTARESVVRPGSQIRLTT